MGKRAYQQFCGLTHAISLVGERWALLIVRDLLVSPLRFTDLHRGLPRIPTNILSARLKELEQAGVVRRELLPRPASGVVYALTEYGAELEPAVLALSRWGAQSMGEPGPDDTVTAHSMIMAIRSTFRPEAANDRPLGFELRLGDVVLGVRVDQQRLTTTLGPLSDPDLTIETGPAIKRLMAGEITPAEAIQDGSVNLIGDPELLDRFAELFQIPPMPLGAPA